MVVPPLPALFPGTILQMLSYFGPFLRAVLLYELKNLPVFSFCPGPLDNQFLLTLPSNKATSSWFTSHQLLTRGDHRLH